MKLERIPEYVLPAVVLLGGMLFAAAAGAMTGGGDTSKLAIVLGAILGLAGMIAMNRNLWVLIPPCWFLVGRVLVLPLPFSVRDLSVLCVGGSVLVLTALKVFRRKPKFEALDLLLAFNLVYLATCFARNPVGFDASNSAIVGGKPYFDVCIAMLAYWILVRMEATPRLANIVTLLCVASAALMAVLTLGIRIRPSIYPALVLFYSGLDRSGYALAGAGVTGDGVQRFMGFRDLGRYGGTAICSFFPPLSLLLPINFGRFLGFGVVCAMLLMSGFRSEIIYFGVIFFLGIYFRSGWGGVIGPVLAVVLTIVVTTGGQGYIYQLPLEAQRALSFLPGKWDPRAIDSGRGSTEWRVEMWKIVLTSDRYIRNKFLGDGFGFPRREFESIQQMSRFGAQTDAMTREVAMIAGDYHSGPITTLKFVGVPGVVLFYLLMFAMAREAARVIRRAKSTPYFPFALFVGMPIIIEPFFFTLIFGGFNTALPQAIFNLGMLKLAKHALDTHLSKVESVAPAASPKLRALQQGSQAPVRRPQPLPARG